MSVLIVNGPNLNLLGTREPDIYGAATLAQIEAKCLQIFSNAGIDASFMQSNAEHEIVDCIQQAMTNKVEYIIINPAAFTHTSVAIRDALLAVNIPFIEIHLSNPHSREAFRRHSYLTDVAKGVIAGFGEQSYYLACQAVINQLKP
ncbi:type II 3-dehydroquinate dehydratase [Aliikangiella maris]|uniref:3-dehydroquinate dehydratase n=2 Tax=Aliikangiella maris TaxID=3162458 RepID=A0ABV2BSK4_9GAMM